MADRPDPSLSALQALYRAEKRAEEVRGNWVLVVLHRPIGFHVARAAIRLGWSPTRITLLSAVLVPLLPAAALSLPPLAAAIAVTLLGHAILVLDCADGDAARFTRETSRRGADLDLLTDMAFWGALYLSVGIVADRAVDGGAVWTALAAFAAWIRLYARTVRDRAADKLPVAGDPPRGLGEIAMAGVIGIDGLLPFLALLALGGGWPVIILLAVSLGDLLWAGRTFASRSRDETDGA